MAPELLHVPESLEDEDEYAPEPATLTKWTDIYAYSMLALEVRVRQFAFLSKFHDYLSIPGSVLASVY